MTPVAGYYGLLIAGWVGAWLLFRAAGIDALPGAARFAYWTTAKLLIWIAPVALIVRFAFRQPLAAYLGLVRAARGVRVGLAVGAAFVALAAVFDVFTRGYGWPSAGWGQVNALVVSPLFEEVMFRGYVLRTLEDDGYGFWRANLTAALMFLGLHLPGWFFMGVLQPSQVVTGVSIVLIGLVAGYARRRAGSTWAAVAMHFVNNLYAASLR